MMRRSRQRGARTRPALLEERPHLRAQIRAVEAQIAIHRILDRGDSLSSAESPHIPLGDAEERAQMPARPERPAERHGGEALEARTAQQLQQQRLGLVLRVVGGQEAFAGCER